MMKNIIRSTKIRFVAPLAVMMLVGAVGTYLISAGNAQTISGDQSCYQATTGSLLPSLKLGDSGGCVTYLQSGLRNVTYTDITRGSIQKSYDVDPTGTYDTKTQQAVADLQTRLARYKCSATVNDSQPLTPAADGNVDTATWYFVTTLSGKAAFANGTYSCQPGNLFAE